MIHDLGTAVGQDPTGVDVGFGPAAGVQQGQLLGAGDVDVLPATIDPGRGLVRADHRLDA